MSSLALEVAERTTIERLLLVTWHTRVVNDVSYWFKCAFDDKNYWLLWTDLATVWFRHGDPTQLRRELADFNPGLTMDTDRLLQRLKQYLTEPSTAVEWQFVHSSGAIATLELRTEIGKYRFRWQFALHSMRGASVARDLLREQLLLPMVDLVRAYEHRVSELSILLHRHEALVLEKVPRQMLPAELRSTVNDADLERIAVHKMSESESSSSLFKEDTFAERAFTHRLRRSIEQQHEREVKRARLAPSSQASASAPLDGGGATPSSLAVASSPPPPEPVPRKPVVPKTEPSSKSSRSTPAAAAAVSPPTPAAALARADSIEETAEELERRRELEARLEQERVERTKRKAAATKPGGKKGFL